jgi:hypothetical protein
MVKINGKNQWQKSMVKINNENKTIKINHENKTKKRK